MKQSTYLNDMKQLGQNYDIQILIEMKLNI